MKRNYEWIPGADSPVLNRPSQRGPQKRVERRETKHAMIRPIVKFPDPILQQVSEPVSVFDKELAKLVEDMFESMYDAQGIGLAAPQIGVNKRITVIDLSNKDEAGRQAGADQSRDYFSRGQTVFRRRLPEPAGDSREGEPCREGKSARTGCEGEVVRDGRQRSCCRVASSMRSITLMASCFFFASAD